jgi:16S rRNA C1402 N4-methylase RsmH
MFAEDIVRLIRGAPSPDRVVVGDVTGLKSRIMLHTTWGQGRVLTIERNERVCGLLELVLEPFEPRSLLRCERLPLLERIAREEGLKAAGAVLIDIGSLIEVIEGTEKGAIVSGQSFLDRQSDPGLPLTLHELVYGRSESELVGLLLKMDDLLFAMEIGRAIARQSLQHAIGTIGQLVALINFALRAHPPAIQSGLVAQALVVLASEVAEVEQYLLAVLTDCARVLIAGGVLLVIGYSNHQERLVRDAASLSGGWMEITDSPIRPDPSAIDEGTWDHLARLIAFRWQPACGGRER